MRRPLERIGIVVFFLAWPALYLYLRNSERTRVIFADGDKILVTKNWLSDGKWSLPGGGLHKNESIVQGAQREVREEIGVHLETRQLRFIGERSYYKYGHRFAFHIFAAQAFDEFELKRQRHEISQIEWIDYHLLNETNAGSDVMLALNAWLKL